MQKSDLLKCVARAFVKYGGNIVGGGIAGNLAVDIWDTWEKSKKTEAERKAELEKLAQEPATKLNEEVKEVIQEIAPNQSPEVKQALKDYLNQVPAMVRRSLKRPEDSRGVSVPGHMRMNKAEDLAWMLPDKLPQFKPGQHPLPGVDLELIEMLGVGGFGEVWKAKNPVLPNTRPVALKFCLDATAAASLRHEAAMLDRVMKLGKEPGIIRLQHTYLSATPPCLEYEYVAGGDLVGVIYAWHHGKEGVTAKHIGRVMARLARIVGVAHAGGIVHRDLKPANILVQKYADGKLHLKVADFGIGGMASNVALKETKKGAKEVTQSTAVRGAYTPLYASPQQMRGDAPDPRDDVYALGVIWYQMLLGDLSVGAPTGRAWQRKLTEGGVTAGMLELLESCIEQEPDGRPANAAALADRLDKVLGPVLPTEVEESPIAYAPPGKALAATKKRSGLRVACALLLLALVAGGGTYALKPELFDPLKKLFRPDPGSGGQTKSGPPKGEPEPPPKKEAPAKKEAPPQKKESPPPPPELPKAALVFESDEVTAVTVKLKGKVVAKGTRQDVKLAPGDYDIEVSGAKPGLRAAREHLTVHPEDKEIKLGAWQADVNWPATLLRANKVPAPVLAGKPLMDDNFQNLEKKLLPEIKDKKGGESGYTGGKYFMAVKTGFMNRDWLAPSPPAPFDDFACQVIARITEAPLTEWGVVIGPEVKGFQGLAVLLNGKSEMHVLSAVPKQVALHGFEVGPFSHPALKQGTEVNKLLTIVHGRQLELYVNGFAVCDPIALSAAVSPSKIRLRVRSQGEAGRVEFERITVWSAKGLPPPEARGALKVK